MKIGVIGTGYVGLVSGTGLAEYGHDVTCIDIDAKKVERMQVGEIPIYEPGLEDVFQRNIRENRLHFSTDLTAVADAEAIFLALPTPQGADGSADLSFIERVAHDLGPLLHSYTVIINKSTVPVGTSKRVRDILSQYATSEFDVVSNPEFLREGQAIQDFLRPDRIVVGTSSDHAAKVMTKLYDPIVSANPDVLLMVMDEASAELTKYAANALLATKISFINGLTELAEAAGADINQVRKGVGSDARIGNQFLYPGPGYGGSCFPKDTHALLMTGESYGFDLEIVRATIAVNERQKQLLPKKIMKYFNEDLHGKKFALWGLAFKDNTDDIRESPALAIIDALTSKGATITAFDPQALENTRRLLIDNTNVHFVEAAEEALRDADALIIATNWSEFNAPDFKMMKSRLKKPVVFDGRNLYDPKELQTLGFHYESIGRATVN